MTFDHDLAFQLLGYVTVGMPTLLVLVLGVASLAELKISERMIGALVQSTIVSGLIASLAILALMLAWNERHVPLTLGTLVAVGEYHFTVKFTFDRLSVPFMILTFLLCGTIGAFANRYLHRERGFNRFFVLFAFFVLGMIIATLAGTIETLFTGWELVGLSSAMLVAFFHDRTSPVQNGLRVWIVYRIADAALLIASVVMHHVEGHGDFDLILGRELHGLGWPDAKLALDADDAFLVGLLLIGAAAGKSALVPFSGWLPRAMEGPTPSSAVFYGALSVHLGAFLLLRFSPIIESSPILSGLVIAIGLTTSIVAAIAERVQTDIKSDLSFASLIQVGIITAEIGCGWYYFALIHILGHACFRTLQFLRAPTILHDYRILENALGSHLPRAKRSWHRLIPRSIASMVYRAGSEKAYLDASLDRWIIGPFIAAMRFCDAAERRWTDFLSGGRAREPEQADPFEELP